MLRVNVNSNSTEQNLIAETALLAAIADDTDLNVPQPQPTRDGQLRTTVWSDDLERDLLVVVMSWLPGRIHDRPSPAEMRALGRALAVLHDHAATWSMPANGAFPSHADVLVEDLHLGNVLWNRGPMSVFDFDDSLIGVPVQDLAISTYYLRAHTDETLDPLFKGYAAQRPLPSFTDDQLESLVAGRNLLLLNELLGVVNSDVRRVLDRYLADTIMKLRAYLETGRYRHAADGVVELGW